MNVPFTAPALSQIKTGTFSLTPTAWVYKVEMKESGTLKSCKSGSTCEVKYSISYTPQWYHVFKAVTIHEQYSVYRVDLNNAINLKKDKIPITTIEVIGLVVTPARRQQVRLDVRRADGRRNRLH